MNLDAKSKAEELFNSYRNSFLSDRMKDENAKKYALITVDELKNMDWYIPNKEEWNKYQNFLDEVKQELEKL